MPRKNKSTSQEPPANTSTPASEPPEATQAADPADNAGQPGFAERVGQRNGIPVPDPFSIAGDYLTGVHLFESKRDGQMAIKFGEGRPEDKPSGEVIGKLKEAGFQWNPIDRIWAHPVWPASAMSTRIKAEKLFQEVSQMVRKDKAIEPQPDIHF
jgi:hypothetical protein